MTDHQPAIGTDDGKVVGNIFGVGWTDANVDQRYPGAGSARQMVRGHLIAMPLRAFGKRLCFGRRMLPANDHIPRQHESVEITFASELLASPAHELIHVAVIVCKQDPALHMAPIAPGIVDEPAEREVGAHGIEQGKRMWIPLLALPQAVCDFIAHSRKPWRWEVA